MDISHITMDFSHVMDISHITISLIFVMEISHIMLWISLILSLIYSLQTGIYQSRENVLILLFHCKTQGGGAYSLLQGLLFYNNYCKFNQAFFYRISSKHIGSCNYNAYGLNFYFILFTLNYKITTIFH